VKSIHEYILDDKDIDLQSFYLPVGADVIAIQKSSKGLILSVLGPLTATSKAIRSFKVCKANETIYYDNVKYIGSYESELGICYVIEVII
jgi:hypothetical protein